MTIDMGMGIAELPESVVWWAMAVSVATFIATLVGVPWVVGRLPSDYFSRPERSAWDPRVGSAALRWAVGLAKNALGALLVVLGTIMLVTPGQGLLTLLVGLLLMDFPGKFRLERWLVHQPGVFKALNWLRRRRRRPSFEDPW